MKTFLSLLILFALVACGGYSKNDKKQFDEQIKTYLEKNKITAKKSSSGVYTKLLYQGTGEPVKYNDQVRVIYKGNLLDGKSFDTQLSPIEFHLKTLIPAWKEALIGVKEGSSILIVTPPQMAYGSQSKDKIPRNSILVFDITVLERK